MDASFEAFDMGLRKFAEQSVPEAVGDLRDAVALEAHRGAAMMTIVRSGRARANWQVTVGAPAEGHTDDVDPSGEATLQKGAAVIASAKRNPFAAIWLHNGLPYIKAMNEGTHNFVNVGAMRMVEATVARIQRMFR